jgi:hypothetical protein
VGDGELLKKRSLVLVILVSLYWPLIGIRELLPVELTTASAEKGREEVGERIDCR